MQLFSLEYGSKATTGGHFHYYYIAAAELPGFLQVVGGDAVGIQPVFEKCGAKDTIAQER